MRNFLFLLLTVCSLTFLSSCKSEAAAPAEEAAAPETTEAAAAEPAAADTTAADTTVNETKPVIRPN